MSYQYMGIFVLLFLALLDHVDTVQCCVHGSKNVPVHRVKLNQICPTSSM